MDYNNIDRKNENENNWSLILTWNNLLKKISDYFKPKNKQQYEFPEHLDQLNNELYDSIKSTENILLSNVRDAYFTHQINLIGSYYLKLGYLLGKMGQKKDKILEIASKEAQSIQNRFKTYYEVLLNDIEGKLSLQSKKMEDTQTEQIKHAKKFNAVQLQMDRYPGSFSLPLGYFYVIIAFILILADIPLALKLTVDGFDLDVGKGQGAIKNLFYNFWQVLLDNWEVFLLSTGIALCTVFIKIMYDEFIASPLEGSITVYRDIEGIKCPEDENLLRRNHKIRVIVKLVILALTLGTIILLGLFRYNSMAYVRLSQEIDDSANLNFTTNGKEWIDKYNQLRNDQKGTELMTFIAITLLFPVIGGVCLSLGTNYVLNNFRYKKAKSLLTNSKGNYIKEYTRFNELSDNKTNWKDALVWCNKDEFKELHYRYFLNQYQLGYDTGFIESLNIAPDDDLFVRTEKYFLKNINMNSIILISSENINK